MHFKANPAKTDANTETNASLKKSPLSAKVSFEKVYNAAQQRDKFAAIFQNTAIVDKYMPADGKYIYLVAVLNGQLKVERVCVCVS